MPIDRRTTLKDLLAAATLDLQELSRRDAVILELRPLKRGLCLEIYSLPLQVIPPGAPPNELVDKLPSCLKMPSLLRRH
jgi:hypothetical protein